jgi:hypothetical protein
MHFLKRKGVEKEVFLWIKQGPFFLLVFSPDTLKKTIFADPRTSAEIQAKKRWWDQQREACQRKILHLKLHRTTIELLG